MRHHRTHSGRPPAGLSHHSRRVFIKRALAATGLVGSIRGLAAERQWTALRHLLDGYVADKKLAGASLALVHGDAPVTYLAAGTIALDSATRFDEDSICRIASMSKVVTGTAAMQIIADGKLSLDQPVADVLPEWRVLRVAFDRSKNLDSRPATAVMTMRHLLAHTSGLADWAPSAGSDPLSVAYRERGITPGNRGSRLKRPGYGPQAVDLADMVRRAAELPLVADPGTVYGYSSVGYAALGLVVERVSGRSFDTYCLERIFGPLGMMSTAFRVGRDQLQRLTTNYDVTAAGLAVTDAAATSAWREQPTLIDGGGGVISTARDFARFSTMIVNDGRLGDVEILPPKTARLARANLVPAGLLAPSNLMSTDMARQSGYGAGMRVMLARQGARPFQSAGTVSHGGAAGTVWFADPVHRATLVFMTQSMPPYRDLASALLEAVESDTG
jgi:CubicO group peptidase (beta-lactamase class C family)